jgi:hypothetical protein
LKQTLTSLQIIQIITGGSYALLHLFTTYTIPVLTAMPIPSAATSLVSTASTAAAQPSGFANWLKIIGRRAAGVEGTAENLRGTPPSPSAMVDSIRESVYETTWQATPCITNDGQAFAIWLNIVYFLPLLALFVRFFIKAYTHRASKYSSERKKIEQSAKDAVKGMKREATEEENSSVRLSHGKGASNGAVKG